MNSKNFFTISLVGIFIVLFFSGVLLGYLCYALFFDNKITPPENTHQISLSTTLETENIFQKEEENHPTILTHEDVPIEKIDSKSFTLEKPILTFIKENIDLEDFSITEISDTKYKISAKIPEIKRVTELIPSLKNYSFFIRPFVGKDFSVYVNVIKKTSTKAYCEIEKMQVDRFFIRKNMIKSFISFADFEINLPSD